MAHKIITKDDPEIASAFPSDAISSMVGNTFVGMDQDGDSVACGKVLNRSPNAMCFYISCANDYDVVPVVLMLEDARALRDFMNSLDLEDR